MSNTKYILLLVVIGSIAWVTEPLWMKTNTSVSSLDIHIKEQDKQRNKLIAEEAEKQNKLEEKFGKKPAPKYSTGVPPAIYVYWNKTLSNPKSLEEERCGSIRAGGNGWTTVCRYRIKSNSGSLELRQDTYTIKHGKVLK